MSHKFYMGGVCGMGMAPLAAFLKDEGADVEGFDDHANVEVKSALEKCRVKVGEKLDRDIAANAQTLVISTALIRRLKDLQADFPQARIIQRGRSWAELCAPRRLTAVVGSHGKSTVSALLAHAVNALGLDAGYLVGAVPQAFPMHKYCAKGGVLISEIDESDGTIEEFSPEITLALNADLDHTDTYADNSHLEAMFARLFERTRKMVIYPKCDELLAKIAKYSRTPSRAVEIGDDFMESNRRMALAALEETFGRGFDSSVFDSYMGLLRRQEIISDTDEIFAMADYAHHPGEVDAFLKAFLKLRGKDSLVVFQPHRYTRTRRFASEFAKIFENIARNGADVVLLPVYPASEPFDQEGTSEAISSRAREGLIRLASPDDFSNILQSHKQRNGGSKISVAVVGAGDFYFPAKDFFQKK